MHGIYFIIACEIVSDLSFYSKKNHDVFEYKNMTFWLFLFFICA